MHLKSLLITFPLLILAVLIAQNCGRAYFPIELKLQDRNDRTKNQQEFNIKLIPLTDEAALKANKVVYSRRVIEAGDLMEPAKIVSASQVLNERIPLNNDPGPYKIGVGDVMVVAMDNSIMNGVKGDVFSRELIVSDDGFLNILNLGRIKANGLTQSELEDSIRKRIFERRLSIEFELYLKAFRSKKVFINGDSMGANSIPYTNVPIYLQDVLSALSKTQYGALIRNIGAADAKITIQRDGEIYILSMSKILRYNAKRIRLFPDDKVYIKSLNFRKEAVTVVGETGSQVTVEISSTQRPTLSEVIFNGSVLSETTSDFSQIYVLRDVKKHINAYHLDITNPARIIISRKFEMRPDDIVFVATQPLSLYSRALSQILGSTGLTFQARDALRRERVID